MEINDAVKSLSALAQESRLEIFRLLVTRGSEGIPAGQIAEELGVAPATLSFHLKELANANLIDSRREGRSIIYFLHVAGMQTLLTFLTEDCCAGHPELCNSKVGKKVCSENGSRKQQSKQTTRKRRNGR